LGYGAEGMLSGNSENTTILLLQIAKKTRQFYLSLDVDLTKIETKSHFKDIFSVFNTLKFLHPQWNMLLESHLKGT
jgi:hypothetical protein